MIKIEKVEVLGWEAAIRGMRNPMESHRLSDSAFNVHREAVHPYHWFGTTITGEAVPTHRNGMVIGVNDHDLMMRLRNAGTDHRKYMRFITVFLDITAPMYWWKEFDTYKVGTVRNSCSTMHKIHAKEFTLEDFSNEHLCRNALDIFGIIDVFGDGDGKEMMAPIRILEMTIEMLNTMREKFLETQDKEYWWQMIQLLPSSYNQKATISLNYEVLANMYRSRKNHKLDEWREFCKWIESLPYSEIITGPRSDGEPIDF